MFSSSSRSGGKGGKGGTEGGDSGREPRPPAADHPVVLVGSDAVVVDDAAVGAASAEEVEEVVVVEEAEEAEEEEDSRPAGARSVSGQWAVVGVYGLYCQTIRHADLLLVCSLTTRKCTLQPPSSGESGVKGSGREVERPSRPALSRAPHARDAPILREAQPQQRSGGGEGGGRGADEEYSKQADTRDTSVISNSSHGVALDTAAVAVGVSEGESGGAARSGHYTGFLEKLPEGKFGARKRMGLVSVPRVV